MSATFGCARRPERAVTELRGRDVVDLLHRLTTNEVRKAQAGQVLPNVFTNENGRVIDFAWLWFQADRVLLVHSHGTDFVGWFDRMTFREDVTVTPLSHVVMSIVDAAAEKSLETEAVPLAHNRSLDAHVSIARYADVGLDALHVLAPEAQAHALSAKWPELPLAAREWARISARAPASGRELTLERNPHELDFGAYINWNKGCYIGQEVIARLDTYDKVQRHLTLLELERAVTVGDDVLAGDDVIGTLSSVAEQAGKFRALAVLKKHGDKPLSVRTASGIVAALTRA